MRYAYQRVALESVPLEGHDGDAPRPVPGGGRVIAAILDFEGETELLVEYARPDEPSQDAAARLGRMCRTLEHLAARWLREARSGPHGPAALVRGEHAADIQGILELTSADPDAMDLRTRAEQLYRELEERGGDLEPLAYAAGRLQALLGLEDPDG